MAKNSDSLYKLLLMGDAQVGKRSFLLRYCENAFSNTSMTGFSKIFSIIKYSHCHFLNYGIVFLVFYFQNKEEHKFFHFKTYLLLECCIKKC